MVLGNLQEIFACPLSIRFTQVAPLRRSAKVKNESCQDKIHPFFYRSRPEAASKRRECGGRGGDVAFYCTPFR